jgi:hypothetical protein
MVTDQVTRLITRSERGAASVVGRTTSGRVSRPNAKIVS